MWSWPVSKFYLDIYPEVLRKNVNCQLLYLPGWYMTWTISEHELDVNVFETVFRKSIQNLVEIGLDILVLWDIPWQTDSLNYYCLWKMRWGEVEARRLLSSSIERSVLWEMFTVNVHWFSKRIDNSWHVPSPSPSDGCTWLSEEASWFIQDTRNGSSLLTSDNRWFDSLPKISSVSPTRINPLLWLQIDV